MKSEFKKYIEKEPNFYSFDVEKANIILEGLIEMSKCPDKITIDDIVRENRMDEFMQKRKDEMPI
jgi:hypothetical protein